jgi:hypothetical protein
MAQKRIGTRNNEQPDFVKLALLIGGGYLLYKLVKKIGGVISDPTGVIAENEDLQSQIVVDTTKLTYPNWQYAAWANALETALLLDIDENETAVDGIIWQIQNDNDWAKLVQEFGVRQDYNLGFVPGATYSLPAAILTLTPERVQDYNNHFAGWGMKARI